MNMIRNIARSAFYFRRVMKLNLQRIPYTFLTFFVLLLRLLDKYINNLLRIGKIFESINRNRKINHLSLITQAIQ